MKLISSLTLLLLCSVLMGQSLRYKIIEENPDKVFKQFIAPEFGVESNSTSPGVYWSKRKTGHYSKNDAGKHS